MRSVQPSSLNVGEVNRRIVVALRPVAGRAHCLRNRRERVGFEVLIVNREAAKDAARLMDIEMVDQAQRLVHHALACFVVVLIHGHGPGRVGPDGTTARTLGDGVRKTQVPYQEAGNGGQMCLG